MSSESTEKDLIGYAKRSNDAMLGLVKELLQETAENGLPIKHHFFISFKTYEEGVELSAKLQQDHPDEMTIILQNKFKDLTVTEEYFSVHLSFNHIPETVIIPFKALTRFYDPYVKFGILFEDYAPESYKESEVKEPLERKLQTDTTPTEAEIISLDSFRKK